MYPKTLLTALLFSLLLFYSCEKNVFQSEPEPEPVPGPRNYVWELDTLDMPMNWINRVWGAAPNDVWAIGGGGTESDRLHHYDGTQWSVYTKEKIWCTGFTIFGFSTDNVWMGGGAGWFAHGAGIWHYNGIEWKEHYVYDVEGSWDIRIFDIWGPAPNDLYACGTIGYFDGVTSSFRGFVLHFNGKNWREVVRAQFNSQFLRIRKEQNKVYVSSYGINHEKIGDSDVEFYQVKGNQLKLIYSNKKSQINWASHNIVDGKAYFVIGQNIFRYLDGKMVEQFSMPYSNLNGGIAGRNEYDLFFPMKDGIVHSNGTDMEYIYKFPLLNMSTTGDPLIFEKDIFYCIDWPGGAPLKNNMILHGKLP